MERNHEQQKIKDALNNDIFSKHNFKSKKDLIIQKALNSERQKVRSVYFHHVLTAIAILLFSVISISFVYNHWKNQDSGLASNEDEQEVPYEVEEEAPTPTESMDDMLKGRTGQEWRKFFLNLYSKSLPILEFERLNLQYTLQSNEDTQQIEVRIDKGNGFKLNNTINLQTKEVQEITDIYLNGQEYSKIFHSKKQYETLITSSIDELVEEERLLNHIPILFDTVYTLFESEDIKWAVQELNESEKWVVLEGLNSQKAEWPITDRSILKINYENGVILERTDYSQQNVVSKMIVSEIEVDGQISKQDFHFDIPEGYHDRNKQELERVNFEQEWFDLARGNVIGEFTNVENIVYSGEKDYLNFVIIMKPGSNDSDGKIAGDSFFKQITEIANSSQALQAKSLSIWDEGQYDFSIRVDIPNKASLYSVGEPSSISWTTNPQ
ncbi:hypothetical protein [Robertmurraya sp. P23]|uniref:hypothetical protein n=1 Tax=Robertmurraya sp. P23 TaxID=3436931 RepID=UPI003D98EDEA